MPESISNRFKMSQERLDSIKEELRYLETVREKEVAELIKEARSFGDLSENSEYDEAKTEQGKLYSRIAELKDLIENAIIDNSTAAAGTIGHGSLVKVRDLEDDSVTSYRIVGSQDADPMQGKVSTDSPFGRSLMGHKVGDRIDVKKNPANENDPILSSFEILAIEN
jgi:transcription elongation factor GreA